MDSSRECSSARATATDNVLWFTRLGRDAAITTLLNTRLLLPLRFILQRLDFSSE